MAVKLHVPLKALAALVAAEQLAVDVTALYVRGERILIGQSRVANVADKLRLDKGLAHHLLAQVVQHILLVMQLVLQIIITKQSRISWRWLPIIPWSKCHSYAIATRNKFPSSPSLPSV